MTQIQQDESDLEHKLDVSRVKPPISERKLQANRANVQRSTGPRTEAGKTASSKNALKPGILSCSLDLGTSPEELRYTMQEFIASTRAQHQHCCL